MRELTAGLEEQVRFRTEQLEQRNSQLADAMSELTKLNRMATAGKLTATIAHEVKQPLTAILGRANSALRWLSRENSETDRARYALDQIVVAGHHATDVVTNVGAMFRKVMEEKTPADLTGGGKVYH